MLKFLPGIFIVQLASAAMAYSALKADGTELKLALALLAVVVCLITGFWFASMSRQERINAVAQAETSFSKEREKLKVNAEKQKTKIIRDSHSQILKEAKKTQTSTSFKLGAAFIGVIGAGSLLLFSQLMTLGLLTFATGGGALLGYMARNRQYNLLQHQTASQQYIEQKSYKP